jgi:hypothetical protein
LLVVKGTKAPVEVWIMAGCVSARPTPFLWFTSEVGTFVLSVSLSTILCRADDLGDFSALEKEG